MPAYETYFSMEREVIEKLRDKNVSSVDKRNRSSISESGLAITHFPILAAEV